LIEGIAQESRRMMIDTVKLWHLLKRLFNLEELHNLCVEMDIEFEDLEGRTLSTKTRELIGYCSRHSRVEELRDTAQRLRPTIDWTAETMKDPEPPSSVPQPIFIAQPGSPAGAADAVALAISQAVRVMVDMVWRSMDEQNYAAVSRPHTAQTAEAQSGPPGPEPVPPAVPAAPQPASAHAYALAALREFRDYLDEAWGVFTNQADYRNRLYQMIEANHPELVTGSSSFDELFFNAYPVLSTEEKELFAIVRGLTERDAFTTNSRIRRWIEEHPLVELLPERTLAVAKLEEQVSLLKMHLDFWFKLFNEKFLPDERRALVYPGVELRRLEWPSGVEPATDAVIAELSKGEMCVTYDHLIDSLTLVFSDAPVAKSTEGNPGLLLDYDAQGNLVSLKILEASRRVEVPVRVSFETV
jgi:hypothetical protein